MSQYKKSHNNSNDQFTSRIYIVTNTDEKNNVKSEEGNSVATTTACRNDESSVHKPVVKQNTRREEEVVEEGRERLKRHRVEVAGRVWVPDMWGQENLLKDWIDCAVFDSNLVNSSIMSARAAMMEQAVKRKVAAANSTTTYRSIENSC